MIVPLRFGYVLFCRFYSEGLLQSPFNTPVHIGPNSNSKFPHSTKTLPAAGTQDPFLENLTVPILPGLMPESNGNN